MRFGKSNVENFEYVMEDKLDSIKAEKDLVVTINN